MARCPLILSLCALVFCACPGEQKLFETGEMCWDSKDNDFDGLVDCKDPDCSQMGICKLRLDGGTPPDTRITIKKDSGKKKDLKTPGDVRPWPPDKGNTGNYGTKCTWSSRNKFCSDGKHHCIQGLNSKRAYCTKPCAKLGDICGNLSGGTFAACLYKFNGRPYCSFLCRFQGRGYKCPAGFACVKWTSTQSYCWP